MGRLVSFLNVIGLQPLVRAVWRLKTGVATLLALSARHRQGVFYGGARAGDSGGPLVKVRLLSQRFPEHRRDFAILYQLSNALYLPLRVVQAVKASGRPVVLNQNGVFYAAWHPDGWERENARMAHVHALATHVLYQSEFCRRCALTYLGPRDGPSQILYNAVDTQRFTPASERLSNPRFTFLSTGKITPATGYRLLAEVAALAEARRHGLDAALRIAGWVDDSTRREAQRLAEDKGIEECIDWLGPYTAAQAPEIYRQADAFLILKHNDPCPNAVLEAMASGLPVVYSASGGIPELVGTTGAGCDVEESFTRNLTPSTADVVAAMARVMDQREELSTQARRRAIDRFDIRDWLDAHQRLFEKLTKR